MNNNKIIYQNELSRTHKEIIIKGLNNNAYQKNGSGQNNASFSLVIENEKGKFIAGISGFHYYGCFYIDLLFVAAESRSKGYGSKLIKKAEELAHERNCIFIAVNTMNFEAKPFYEKHGYKIEFIREGFEKNAKMYLLRKDLR
jgi:GNAT superfamily N-acetyltransferase